MIRICRILGGMGDHRPRLRPLNIAISAPLTNSPGGDRRGDGDVGSATWLLNRDQISLRLPILQRVNDLPSLQTNDAVTV